MYSVWFIQIYVISKYQKQNFNFPVEKPKKKLFYLKKYIFCNWINKYFFLKKYDLVDCSCDLEWMAIAKYITVLEEWLCLSFFKKYLGIAPWPLIMPFAT